MSVVGQLPVIARGLIPDERFTSCRSTVVDANPDMSQEMAAGSSRRGQVRARPLAQPGFRPGPVAHRR